MAEGVSIETSEPEVSAEALALADLARKAREGEVDLPDPLAPKLSETPRPEHIPEKFWDPIKGVVRVDEMAKSYSELERMKGKPAEEEGKSEDEQGADDEAAAKAKAEAEEAAAKGEPDGEEEEEEEGSDKEPSAALKSAIETAQSVYAETGDLDESSRKSLIDAGISAEQIDIYIEGVKALERALQASAHEAAGGAAEFEQATAWAADNWSKEEILAFNAAVANPKLVKNAVKGLMASFNEAEPGEGRLTNLGGGGDRGDVYQSMAEFHQDLAKADETRDPVARRKAVDKLSRSRKAGTVKSERRNPFGN